MTEAANDLPVTELFNLAGRTALVTAGSSWLGHAFSEALAEAGANVVVSSRDLERARQYSASLPRVAAGRDGTQANHSAVRIDHQDADSLAEGFRQVADDYGHLDILVSNALDPIGKDLTNVSYDEFNRHQVNNGAAFELARQTRDLAVQNGRPASIVLIGSMYGVVGSYPDAYEGVQAASPVAYHALKGGTIHMTRHLAAYWAKDGVRVNCLSPGPFPHTSVSTDLTDRLEKKCPMGRMGQPHELKGALLLFASDAGSYITGQNLLVDGGWTAW